MGIFSIAPLLLVFPLIGVLFNGLVGRRFVEYNRETGEKWSGWFGSVMALSALAVAVTLLFALAGHEFHAEIVVLFDWIHVGDFYVPWAMQIDTLSVTMMLVVTGVGSLIHIYAIGYMHGDPNFSPLFHLPEPVHLFHADFGVGQQLPGAVCRLGRRGPVLLPADQLLVGPGGQEGRSR
jgi:formate hydrogenlyase subunit 3/multisubunit Na+/H+ antiporter MnhD subunit